MALTKFYWYAGQGEDFARCCKYDVSCILDVAVHEERRITIAVKYMILNTIGSVYGCGFFI